MNYRNVGKSGLKVSEVSLGSWMTDLRGSEKYEIAKKTVQLAYEQGVNFLIAQMLTATERQSVFWEMP